MNNKDTDASVIVKPKARKKKPVVKAVDTAPINVDSVLESDTPLATLRDVIEQTKTKDRNKEVNSIYSQLSDILKNAHADFAYALDSFLAIDANVRAKNGTGKGLFTQLESDELLNVGTKFLVECKNCINILHDREDKAIKEYIKSQFM